jgi:hypothetical protein
VSDDFKADHPATDPAVVEDATRLNRDLEQTAQPAAASRAAADEMEAAFAKRVQYMATLDSQYQRALQLSGDSAKQERHRVASYEPG